MPTAVVLAKYVNPPKDGKKWANIKAPDGKYYNYESGKFSPVQGQTYTIDFDEKTRDDGSVWRPIKNLTAAQQVGSTSSTSVPGNNNTGMEIFVTGMIGRCFHGTGQFPGQNELTSMVRSARLAWIAGMKNVAQTDEPPLPSEEDYGQ